VSSASYKHWVLNIYGARKIHICTISNTSGEVVGIGHAICNPEDKYSRERGREIAQGRALKEYRKRPRTQLDELEDEEALLKHIEEIYAVDVSDSPFCSRS
jgi:hypothetical protein